MKGERPSKLKRILLTNDSWSKMGDDVVAHDYESCYRLGTINLGSGLSRIAVEKGNSQ